MRWLRRRAGASGEDGHSTASNKCCMFEIMAFLVFGTIGVLADRYSSRRKYQPQTLGDAMFTFIFVGLAYAFCAGVGKRIFQSTSRRRAAVRLARLRQRFPTSGKWPDRGWLVMLRARDRRSALAQSPRWLSLLQLCCIRHRRARLPLRNTVVLFDATVAGDGDEARDVEMERCETGRSGLEFTSTVVRVVEMEEEGLFRNIVTFL